MMKFPAGWYREILQLDPPSIYAQVHCPTLVIGGSKDMQCDPNDVELVGNAVQGEAETHVVVDMTHVLRKEPGDISFSTNARLLKQPVDDELLAIMKQWLCVKA